MRTLTVAKAAKLIKRHPITVLAWIRKGIIPERRPPGTRKHIIHEADLASFIPKP
tara:strand:- start:389 stop:553 length:165 start_codon:yes stop_codon:yes gene_type:complete